MQGQQQLLHRQSTPTETSTIDQVQRKQEDIERKLSYRFQCYAWLLVFFTAVNTFFVVFHRYDSRDSELTLRYKLGYIFYFINFLSSSLILLGTFLYSFVLYARLAIFLKPKRR